MRSPQDENDETEDRCSACPPREGEEGEPILKPLTGWELYLMHKRYVDKEAEQG